MEHIRIETDRLILRKFEESDMEAIYSLLSDEEVNTFLPWYPVKDMAEAKSFFEERLRDQKYGFAICLKSDDRPIGHVHVEAEDDSHDLGYALDKAYWHQGIVSEACLAVIDKLKEDGIPYITATHDINNVRSGKVMQRIGMTYKYSFKERWMPKDIDVIFCMYQLNLDGIDRTYQKYWDMHPEHYI